MNLDWLTVPASDFCSKVTDGTHDTPKPCQLGKPLITSKHIKKSAIDFDSAYQISVEDFEEINRRSKVDQWDVIISMIGAYCGYCFIEKNENPDYAVKNVGLFKAGSRERAEWLYYFLDSPLGQARLEKARGGSSQPYLPLGGLRALEISFPKDPAVLSQIVTVLSNINAKIELNQRINAELEALAKTIYDYWFVQFDFPDENGRPYKSSGGAMEWSDVLQREIPAGWNTKSLSDIANITMGQSPPGDSYNEVGEGIEFFQGCTDFGRRSPDVRLFTSSPNRMAKVGDILLSVRAPVGSMNIADRDCCIGRGLAALNSKQGFDAYLYYVMAYFKRLFDRRNSEGTTFGSITKNDLADLKVVAPDTATLRAYDKLASQYNQLASQKNEENRELIELRDWLLPMLMNGQVRVA